MADAVRDYGAKVTVVVHFENPQEVVIPKRGIFARGICYFRCRRQADSSPPIKLASQ